jgi:capsular polysaccharide biosynthesis protein
LTLPTETVRRELPILRNPEDARLFAAEVERVFPAVETAQVSGEFFPDGWYRDSQGFRSAVKRAVVRLTTRRRVYPRSARAPLIATDRFSNGYFHWVTETLPRLWWVKDQLVQMELLLPAFAARLSYMVESLALFPELSFRIIGPRERWRLREAVLVPAAAPGGNFRPALVQPVGQAWRERVTPREPFRKLYVSRSLAARRRISNEPEVVAVLKARGFETVHLEGMAFADQVRLLAETVHLISNHGAGLTNMLFMVPGSRVTEVRLAGDTHNNCYFSLARALGLDYDYRLGLPSSPAADPHTADLVVDPRDLA